MTKSTVSWENNTQYNNDKYAKTQLNSRISTWTFKYIIWWNKAKRTLFYVNKHENEHYINWGGDMVYFTILLNVNQSYAAISASILCRKMFLSRYESSLAHFGGVWFSISLLRFQKSPQTACWTSDTFYRFSKSWHFAWSWLALFGIGGGFLGILFPGIEHILKWREPDRFISWPIKKLTLGVLM